MIEKVVSVVITVIVSGAIGYLVNSLKLYKNKEKATEVALMTLLQSNLTNTYFVYDKLKEIPDYIYQNWLNELKVYEDLGGNSYIHILAKKMEQWNIKSTDNIIN